jgi:methionyl-tRNA synthetase
MSEVHKEFMQAFMQKVLNVCKDDDKQCHFITSALPYVNNILHLGNIIGSLLSADVHARFLRRIGKNVLYVCGTDEYGTTTEIKALREELTCQEICDKYHALQKHTVEWFNISCDVFGRTTTETQTELAQDIFLRLWKAGHLCEQIVEQPFCTTCDTVLADRYVNGLCYHAGCGGQSKGDQCDKCGNLIDVSKLQVSFCSQCDTITTKKTSEHLFLKLDDFKDKLIEYFKNDVKYMSPTADSITKAWLAKDLENRCITRDLKWGTPVPRVEGLEKYWDKVFYVWFDAPIGYISILKHARPDDWHNWLKGNWYQFMAKDNVPFHTVIFPSTLIGSNFDSTLVTHLSAVEYLDFEGEKFSKSKGIGIFCDQIESESEELEIDEDYWRYYLLKIRPETADSSFSWKGFADVVRGELAFKIGNLMNRAVSLGKKWYKDKLILECDLSKFEGLHYEIVEVLLHVIEMFSNFEYTNAIRLLNRLAEIGNEFLNDHTVWEKLRIDTEGNSHYICIVMTICWLLGEFFEPIMPTKCKQIKKVFCVSDRNMMYQNIVQYVVNGNISLEINYDGYTMLFNKATLEQKYLDVKTR